MATEGAEHANANAKSQPVKSVRKACDKPSANGRGNLREGAEEVACEKEQLPNAICEHDQCDKVLATSQATESCPAQTPAQARLAARHARVLARVSKAGSS